MGRKRERQTKGEQLNIVQKVVLYEVRESELKESAVVFTRKRATSKREGGRLGPQSVKRSGFSGG